MKVNNFKLKVVGGLVNALFGDCKTEEECAIRYLQLQRWFKAVRDMDDVDYQELEHVEEES